MSDTVGRELFETASAPNPTALPAGNVDVSSSQKRRKELARNPKL